MVAFAIPDVPRRLFPADGHWERTDFWRDSLAAFLDPETAAAATSGLLTVFTPEWAAAVPDQPHTPHPVEAWYGLGSGVARLARLGYCLHAIGEATADLRARLLDREEFDDAEAEVRAAALFAEFRASVEVRRLRDGDPDRLAIETRAALDSAGALIAIVERPAFFAWSTSMVELLLRELKGGRWPSLGAVVLREADASSDASRSAELLHVLAGQRWSELPAELRDRLPTGSLRIDLLPGRSVAVDRSRLDDLDSTRATPPAARLAEALRLMKLGLRLRWSRLRREHPDASVEDLDRMMSEWGTADV